MASWPHREQRSRWPPSVAVRQNSMAYSTRRWSHVNQDRFFSMKSIAVLSDDVGHLEGWLVHRFCSFRERLTSSELETANRIQRVGHGGQMLLRKVQVHGGVFELGMAQQHLDRAQIGAGFEQVSRKTVPQGVRRDVFGDAGPLGGLLAGFPRHLRGDGNIGAPVLHGAGKQIGLGFHPTPIDAKCLQQLRAQRHIAVVAALALTDVHHHALAIDVSGFQAAQLGAAHASGVQRHEHGLVKQVAGRADQQRYLIRAEDLRQLAMPLGHREIIQQVVPFQRLVEEEAESGHVLLHGARIELLVLKQVRLVLAQMVGSELVGSLMEVLGEVLHDSQVAFYGTLGVITTLEFLQHHFVEVGSQGPPCDPQNTPAEA